MWHSRRGLRGHLCWRNLAGEELSFGRVEKRQGRGGCVGAGMSLSQQLT